MKKFYSLLLISCFLATLSAQTIVSTTPSNKNVILEEYTGTNCVFCPAGHLIANTITNSYPARAYVINIHQGGLSGNDPDYKTEWGNALAQQYSISSYPIATINRGTNAVSRSEWTTEADACLAEPSPVNIAATATINWNTRELTVMVEVYYTGNAANPINKLNIALLQNNVLGPQTGGINYYPAMVHFGTLYQHMHMLRHLLTGQWGVEIDKTTTGSFFTQTFTYSIPQHIRNIPVSLEDLEVLAYVCENNRTVLTGCKAELTFDNKPATIGRLDKMEDKFIPTCDGSYNMICYFRNSNDFAVHSVELTYTVDNGDPNVYTWNRKTIETQSWDTIHLPVVVEPGINQMLTVTVSKVNDENCNASVSKTVKKEVPEGDRNMKFILATDRYASETTFKIYNPDGTTLLSDGPFPNLGSNGITVREYDFIPIMSGCHLMEVKDSYGDGINSGSGAGYIKILNSNGTQIFYNNGQFGLKLEVPVAVPNYYKITATAGENGTISPSGEMEYAEGKSAEFVFTPDSNFEVEEVFINDMPMGMEKATNYIFSVVDNNYTIHVAFRTINTISEINGTDISVTPNPTTGELRIELTSEQVNKIEVFDIYGKNLHLSTRPLVHSSTCPLVHLSTTTLNISHFPAGVYFLKIQTETGIVMKKVIKN